MKKNKRSQKISKIWLVGAITLAIGIFLIILLVTQANAKRDELNKIYSSFTCNSCEGSLLINDDFNALGIKQQLKDLQDEGLRGQELYIESVKLLGVLQIMDTDLRERTLEKLRENPPEQRAILAMDDIYVNFGNISESKISFVMKEFEIENDGTEELIIYQIGTSCSCLNTKLIFENGKESPIYGRFSFPSGLTIKLQPGESARLRVKYDARVNSFFKGFETRFVYIYTNDVVNPTRQITVDVNHIA